jgi:uncharacterized protein
VTAPVLSHVTVRPLLEARRRGLPNAELSLDLGLTTATVSLGGDGVVLERGTLDWSDVERIAKSETACFAIERDGDASGLTPEPLKAFSAVLGRLYSLYPTERAPTMLISGIPMHRIKGIDPTADTDRKVAALKPVGGRVLDTATGLGYTAIALARAGAEVTTIELDPLVLELARRNPWSADLFDNVRIEQRIGDAAEIVPTLSPAMFSSVLHDPPVISLAGDLYGRNFYDQLLRVLRPGGRLFHYVGNPSSPSGGRTTHGVVERLSAAGFERVRARPEAFGVDAVRPTGRLGR